MTLSDEECYLRLREAIIREEHLPNERLIEMDIAPSLGAGRAAVRTALARLEMEVWLSGSGIAAPVSA